MQFIKLLVSLKSKCNKTNGNKQSYDEESPNAKLFACRTNNAGNTNTEPKVELSKKPIEQKS